MRSLVSHVNQEASDFFLRNYLTASKTIYYYIEVKRKQTTPKEIMENEMIECRYKITTDRYEYLYIPSIPGVYKCEAKWMCFGDEEIWIAFDGEKAAVASMGSAPKSKDFNKFNLSRMGRIVENNVVILGR